MASTKTTTKPARARILQAILQSKFAFIATYIVPPEHWLKQFEQLVYRLWWWGSTLPRTDRLPSQVPRAILQLPRREGGWAIPNIRKLAAQQAIRRFVACAIDPGTWPKTIALAGLSTPGGCSFTLRPVAGGRTAATTEDTILWGSNLTWPVLL